MAIQWLPDQRIIFTRFRKHHCPDCGKRMMPIKVARTIKQDTLEMEQFCHVHSTMVADNVWGNVTFLWYVLRCPNCERQLDSDEMYEIERAKRQGR